MNYKRIEEIKKIIENSKQVNFAPFGEGTTDEWILKAEKALNIKFPPTYKWWLKNYGGGEIGLDKEIFSIYEMDFDEVVGGDIVYMARINQKNQGIVPEERLHIFEPSNTHEEYYFKPKEVSKAGEYPVYLHNFETEVEELYAKDFFDFLIRILDEYE